MLVPDYIGIWRNAMDKFMNEPIEYEWTDADIIREYKMCGDKKKVAKIYCITAKRVGEILKLKGCD